LTAASLEKVLLKRLAPRSIVCLHDNAMSAANTPAMLRSALPRLIDDGWQFVTLPAPRNDGEPAQYAVNQSAVE
jgi:hypothetical protein